MKTGKDQPYYQQLDAIMQIAAISRTTLVIKIKPTTDMSNVDIQVEAKTENHTNLFEQLTPTELLMSVVQSLIITDETNEKNH